MTKAIFPIIYINYYAMRPHWLIAYLCSKVKHVINDYSDVKKKSLFSITALIFSQVPKLSRMTEPIQRQVRIHRTAQAPLHTVLR